MKNRLSIMTVFVVTVLIILLPLSTELTVSAANDDTLEISGYIAADPNAVTCCITYHANGGIGSYTGAEIISGESDVVLTAAAAGISRDGYNFSGWNAAAEGAGTAYAAGDSVVLNDNVTLYAQWTSTAVKKQPVNQQKTNQVAVSAASTGDENHISIWIGALGMSLLMLTVVGIKRLKTTG